MKGTWFSVDFVLSRDGSQADNLRNSPNEAVLGYEITAKFKGSLKGRLFQGNTYPNHNKGVQI